MLQYIFVSVIVLVAFIAALLPLFRKKKPSSGCDSGCAGCPLADSANSCSCSSKTLK